VADSSGVVDGSCVVGAGAAGGAGDAGDALGAWGVGTS